MCVSSSSISCKFVVLERIRLTLNFLRKANIFSESGNNENPLLANFRELQNIVRYSTSAHLSAVELVGPFLSLLKMHNMSGPFKLFALDSLQLFINSNVLTMEHTNLCSALEDIVEAIIKCKYVQTDIFGDELVQLRLVQTLQDLVTNTTFLEMSDNTIWKILQFLFSALVRNGTAGGGSQILHQTAERVVLDTVKSLLGKEHHAEASTAGEEEGGGLLLKLTLHLLGVVREYIQKDDEEVNSPLGGQTSSSVRHSGFAHFGDAFLVGDAIHVDFALSTLLAMLQMGAAAVVGQTSSPVQIMLVRSPQFRRALSDDLGITILALLNRRKEHSQSPQLLQKCLSLFITLRSVAGPCLKIFVECFVKQVYIRALMDIHALFTSAQQVGELSDAARGPQPSPGSFSVEELGIVLESLCDLLGDPSFVPSLFVSFDCDPTKPDVAQPLLKSLCRCSSFVLRSGAEELRTLKDIGVLVVQLHKHILNSFGTRLKGSEAFQSLQEKVHFGDCDVSHRNVDNAVRSTMHNKAAKMLKAGRIAKQVLQEASRRFVEKPELGLQFLQERGCLPTPLTPSSVSRFLRLTPDLPKEAVGSFLGELGKDDAKFEANSKDFHEKMLSEYVKSFEFGGQSIVDCMRIFLSAFRLPGEAQQIDRILVAFSEFCHSNSLEGRSGVLQNAEVTYLLSFSVIMLNTDQHNPNIRADRRMTLDQFVRNNTNYGKDVNQTVPLSREFLQKVFVSIAESPIRTENHDVSAAIAPEAWKDMQLQSTRDPGKALLVATNHDLHFVNQFAHCQHSEAAVDDTTHMWREEGDHSKEEQLAFELVRQLTVGSALLLSFPHALCEMIHGADWLFDGDLLTCVGLDLMLASVSIHHNNFVAVHQQTGSKDIQRIISVSSTQSDFVAGARERTGKFLLLSNEFLLELLRLLKGHGIDHFLDLAILLLGGFCGIVDGVLTAKVVEFISQGGQEQALWEAVASDAFNLHRINLNNMMNRLLEFSSARSALLLLLQSILQSQSHITCWSLVFFVLGVLRDLTLLPPQVVLESETDILPTQIRHDFELRLAAFDKTIIVENKPAPPPITLHTKSSPSLLSLQGLGEALFGGADQTPGETPSAETLEQRHIESYMANKVRRNNLPSARWDIGYEALSDASEVSNSDISEPASRKSGSPVPLPPKKSMSQVELRRILWTSGIHQVVSDTRFMSEAALCRFVVALINATERDCLQRLPLVCVMDTLSDKNVANKVQISELLRAIAISVASADAITCSSVAWLEMLLVEVSLRNRDRFGAIWPLLINHYSQTLNTSVLSLTYIAERRVIGLMKIATRMISREQFSASVVELLAQLFLRDSTSSGLRKCSVVNCLSDQIAAGMWTLLTLNVEVLPLLPLEQWQTLFGIIALTGASGSFAALKSFESMAWLLHEPRLIAKVPVFCIIGVQPLVKNQSAPTAVSIGAVQLLLHLHSRLEVLIKDDSTSQDFEEHSDHSVLWESCWLPILKALADGTSDRRRTVRQSAVEALVKAVGDKHSAAVPSGVLVDILSDIFIPVLRLLGDSSTCTATTVDHQKVTPHFVRQNWMRVEMRESAVQEKEVVDSESEGHCAATQCEAEEALLAKPLQQTREAGDDALLYALCLTELCDTMARHIRKLSLFPSFDKLWLRIMELLGMYIAAVEDGSSGISGEAFSPLHQLTSAKLKELLETLAVNKVFLRREGLRSITIVMLHTYRGFEAVAQGLESLQE